MALAPLGADCRPLRARAHAGRRSARADAPATRPRESRGPRPAAAPLRAAVHASDASGADSRRQNGIVSHTHVHEHSADRRPLALALVLIVGLMAGEVVFGVVAGSLALMADAGHMLTDAAALGLALAAASFAGRPARGRWTFGFRRLEILAAHVNGITLVVVGVVIVYTAIRRLVDPPTVRGGLVLVVALAGIAVNLAGTALAGGLVLATGWDRFDPIASLLVAALIFWSSFSLLRESTRILLEVSPDEPREIAGEMLGVPGVVEVHDLHVWTVGSGFPSSSAHVLVEPGADCHAIRLELANLLGERFGLGHSTLQVEHGHAPAHEGNLPIASR